MITNRELKQYNFLAFEKICLTNETMIKLLIDSKKLHCAVFYEKNIDVWRQNLKMLVYFRAENFFDTLEKKSTCLTLLNIINKFIETYTICSYEDLGHLLTTIRLIYQLVVIEIG
jgi:hypothetical protein